MIYPDRYSAVTEDLSTEEKGLLFDAIMYQDNSSLGDNKLLRTAYRILEEDVKQNHEAYLRRSQHGSTAANARYSKPGKTTCPSMPEHARACNSNSNSNSNSIDWGED